MAAHPSLTRLPDPGEGSAQFVDIVCSGLDPAKDVEFLVNGTVRGTIPVDIVGEASLYYIVPAGPVRNALADLGHGSGNIETVDGMHLVYVEADSGSMALRYSE
jgi:hypothetical protein